MFVSSLWSPSTLKKCNLIGKQLLAPTWTRPTWSFRLFPEEQSTDLLLADSLMTSALTSLTLRFHPWLVHFQVFSWECPSHWLIRSLHIVHLHFKLPLVLPAHFNRSSTFTRSSSTTMANPKTSAPIDQDKADQYQQHSTPMTPPSTCHHPTTTPAKVHHGRDLLQSVCHADAYLVL